MILVLLGEETTALMLLHAMTGPALIVACLKQSAQLYVTEIVVTYIVLAKEPDVEGALGISVYALAD